MYKTHITQSFAIVQYNPTPEVEAFVARVQSMLENPEVSDDEMVDLIYGPENPIMVKDPMFPEKGMVTHDVVRNPIYLVLTDLLARKESMVRLERLKVQQTYYRAQARG